MPTESFFAQHPPFPEDLPLLPIPKLLYSKLVSNDAAESEALWKASAEHGFFSLRLDGAAENQLLEDVVKVWDLGRQFFDLPLGTKSKRPMNSSAIGYKAAGLLKSKDGRPDKSEILAVSRDSVLTEPSNIPGLFEPKRPLLKSLTERLHAVAELILHQLARHLDIKADAFDRFHLFKDASGTQLRFVHSKPQGPSERQTSLPGHADSGSLTILFNVLGGLQVLPAGRDDVSENWRWIKPMPGCAIVNVGDALVQWTGGAVRSAHHRVLYAPGAQSELDRYSFGYFLKPAEDANMKRFDGSEVIPKLESKDDHEPGSYEEWHRKMRVAYKVAMAGK